ncbi:peptidoglycan-binding protein [Spirillospora sp. NPDC050679]
MDARKAPRNGSAASDEPAPDTPAPAALAPDAPASDAPAPEAPSPDDSGPGTEALASLVRRQRLFLAAALAAAFVSLAGLAASTLVKSPEQVAADSKAPKGSTLTAPVERRVLSSTVIARGKVAASTEVQVTPAGAAAGGDRGDDDGGGPAQGSGAQLLTGAYTKAGKSVRAGDVLVAVSGRPLIALQGKVPLYRDLRPADTGDDVAMLQKALARLGYGRGPDKAGTFGPGTKKAVTGFYTDRRYRVPDTGGVGGAEDREKLRSAREAVTSAQDAVDDMKRRMRSGGRGDAGVPLKIQLHRLERTLRSARQSRDELVASTGPMVPVSEIVVLPSFPARVTRFSAKVGDPVKAPLLVLAVGRLGVTAELPPDQGQLLKTGMKAAIASELLGIEAEGTVSDVGPTTAATEPEQPREDGGGGAGDGEAASGVPHVPVRIDPDGKLDNRWAGQDVRLTITSAATPTEVLVVPLSAVTSGPDGRTTVSKAGRGGAVTRVPVEAGMSGDGFVEVSPVDAGALGPGDRVVVAAA